MWKLILCDYSHTYLLVEGTITITFTREPTTTDEVTKWLVKKTKGVILKDFTLFSDCISKINNKKIDNAKDLDIVMPVYDLTEPSDTYSKTSGKLCPYYRDKPHDTTIANSESFKCKTGITVKTVVAGDTKNVEIAVP